MINSRQKGKRGERAWRDVLISYGYHARRGQQYSGDKNSPDVICDELAAYFHPEVKTAEQLNLYKALEQAYTDCPEGKLRYTAHKKKGKDWLVTMTVEDWMKMLQVYYKDMCQKHFGEIR